MNVPESNVRDVVDRDPELSAAYGTTGKRRPAGVPVAPSQTEILDREEDDMPADAKDAANGGVEIIQMVDQAEKELHLKSLKALGVNEATLTKLRELDGMASSTASFIAIGLEKTHRLYYLAVVDLKTVADQIKERYLDPQGEKAIVGKDLLPFYYRNYIDAVKEFGRAYDLFIQGAAVILKIVGGGNDEDAAKPKKAKLGFTGRSQRNVTPPGAPPNGKN